MPSNRRAWWLVIEHGEVDLCLKNPGFDVDLEFRTGSRNLADVWMGYSTFAREVRNKTLSITGSRKLRNSVDDWFGFSVFTDEKLQANSTGAN